MYFNVKKHIFIHKSFLLLPLLALFSAGRQGYFVMLAFAFLHEAAHYFMALIFKETPDRLFISPYGFELRLHSAAPAAELIIYLAGPLFSLVCTFVFRFLRLPEIARANFILFAINILPAYPLDGGKILKLLLWSKCGVYYGNRWTKAVSVTVSIFLIAAAIYFHTLWLVIISALILLRQRGLNGTPFYRKRKKVTPVKVFYAEPSVPIMEVIRRFSPYYYTGLFLPSCKNVVYEEEIIMSLKHAGYEGTVADMAN